MSATFKVDIYYGSVCRQIQKSKATKQTSHRRGEGVDSPSGFTHLTLLSRRNKPTAHRERELPFCEAARRSTDGGSVDLENRMATSDNKKTRLVAAEQRRKPQAGVVAITAVHLSHLYCTVKTPSPSKGYIAYVPPSPPTPPRPYTTTDRFGEVGE